MNAKTKRNKNQVNNNFSVINSLSADERQSRIEELLNTMQAKTWHDLETSGKFDKNAKLSFISENNMKNYLEIMEDIRKNDNRIKELEAKADALLKKADRAAAESIGEKIKIKKSISEEAEAAAIAAYNEIEEIKSINSILAENVNASFAAYVIPIIKEIMQPYAGKQYGTKTKEKIREEAKKHNIMFYFDGYREQYKVHVFCLTNEGYTDYKSPEIYINATDAAGHTTAFISESNKIQDVNNIVFSSHYKYTENPENKTAELETAYNEFKKLVEATKAAESKLNSLLPDKAKHFDVIGYLSPWQKPY